jgi:hypothetical protein
MAVLAFSPTAEIRWHHTRELLSFELRPLTVVSGSRAPPLA